MVVLQTRVMVMSRGVVSVYDVLYRFKFSFRCVGSRFIDVLYGFIAVYVGVGIVGGHYHFCVFASVLVGLLSVRGTGVLSKRSFQIHFG